MNDTQTMNAPHLKVQVWIYRSSKTGSNPAEKSSFEVLLLHLIPARGGFWQPVTGGVEAGETLPQAALREASEETGLAFKGPLRPLDTTFTFEARGKTFEEHCFALEAAPSGSSSGSSGSTPVAGEVTIDPREHDAFQWTTPSAALELLRHESNAHALRALEKVLRT